MSYKVKELVFLHGEWLDLDGARIVTVLHSERRGTNPEGPWYVTALVEQP